MVTTAILRLRLSILNVDLSAISLTSQFSPCFPRRPIFHHFCQSICFDCIPTLSQSTSLALTLPLPQAKADCSPAYSRFSSCSHGRLNSLCINGHGQVAYDHYRIASRRRHLGAASIHSFSHSPSIWDPLRFLSQPPFVVQSTSTLLVLHFFSSSHYQLLHSSPPTARVS